jgi:hypothetical protein
MSDANFMNDDFEFEKMMQEKLKDNFGSTADVSSGSAGDERLKEMNKKLPSWNLEPPFSFLK